MGRSAATETFFAGAEKEEGFMENREEFLKPGERLDDLQNGYWMIQNPSLFCYGIDAVLLASYAKVKRGECAMDFCTGSGIVPILLRSDVSIITSFMPSTVVFVPTVCVSMPRPNSSPSDQTCR